MNQAFKVTLFLNKMQCVDAQKGALMSEFPPCSLLKCINYALMTHLHPLFGA